MMIITNAFSINMLTSSDNLVHFNKVDLETARLYAKGAESAVGHADTAAVFEAILEEPVPCNRTTLQCERGTKLLIGQYTGPRLAEGTKTLPEGATITWWYVEII